jgi:hypothetical protein
MLRQAMGTNNVKVTSVISNSYKYVEGGRLVRYLKEDHIPDFRYSTTRLVSFHLLFSALFHWLVKGCAPIILIVSPSCNLHEFNDSSHRAV